MDIEINSTKSQVEEFIESILWSDIKHELENWKEGFIIEQDAIVDDAEENNSSTASVLLHIGDLNGRKKAINYMLGIPEVFLDILEDKKDATRRDSTD